MNYGIGIDLGGTQIKGGFFDLKKGKMLAKDSVDSRDGDWEGNVPAFGVEARGLVDSLEKKAKKEAEIAGVSAPGLARRDGSAIASLPNRLDGLEGFVWADVLGKPGAVLNDAHAALMGELWQGGAKGLRDVVLLTLGTGVGGAIVADGKLLRGNIGRAGHLGHLSIDFHSEMRTICGAPGGLEDFVGNHNIVERTGGRFGTTLALVEAVAGGKDEEAERIWDESMRALAAAISSIANVIDPQVVLIGGGISKAWKQIEPRVSHWLDEFEWRPGGARVELRRAELGEWAGAYGAVYNATIQQGMVDE